MNRTFAALLLILWAQPLAGSDDGPVTEDARLEGFFKKYLDGDFRHRPLEATRLGDHRFDHLLDDVSAQGRAAATERTRGTLMDLSRQIDKKKLSRSGKIDFEILDQHLKRTLW